MNTTSQMKDKEISNMFCKASSIKVYKCAGHHTKRARSVTIIIFYKCGITYYDVSERLVVKFILSSAHQSVFNKMEVGMHKEKGQPAFS